MMKVAGTTSILRLEGERGLGRIVGFGEIQSVQTSEATDGTHVRMKVIASERRDLVRWRHVSAEVYHHDRPVYLQALPH